MGLHDDFMVMLWDFMGLNVCFFLVVVMGFHGISWGFIGIYMMGYLPVMTNRYSELEDGPVEMT